MTTYARVLVFLPYRARDASGTFDYHIPPELEGQLTPGMLVIVPFRAWRLPGVILTLPATPEVPETRSIESLLDPDPLLTPALLELAHWMADATLTPLHVCARLILPAGLRPRNDLRLTPQVGTVPPDLPDDAAQCLELLLERGSLNRSQVAWALRRTGWRRALAILREQDLINSEPLLIVPQMRPQTAQMVSLIAPRSDWEARLRGLRLETYPHILEFLAGEPEPVDVSVVYAEVGATAAQLKTLEQRGLLAFTRHEVVRDPLAETIYTPLIPPTLTQAQQAAWELLAPRLAQAAPAPVLLLGVTGSGKTELYLRAAAEVLAQGRQALILTPEISLTPQTVRRFALRFPGKVGLWHSALTPGESFDTWRRVRSGTLQVVVGTRSALFAPFPQLGLIVLDEEEDASYKESRAPTYHAREAAEALARSSDAQLILGSAAPSLEAYQRAQEGRYALIELPQRVMGHRRRIADWQRELRLPRNRYQVSPESDDACAIPLPPVRIVDLRAELKAGNTSIFSRPLQQAVDAALARREQALLFLNRRGTATYVFCRDCGWAATCPRCDIPLTFHAGARALLCHRCSFEHPMPPTCPECNSARVRAFGLGTEGLAEQAAKRWPGARIVRWDRDAARNHAAHTTRLGLFSRGETDMLVGTQMVARGLDLPLVTVVGVISADTALNFPDFRAAERTFQLLTQVAGRAGRGLLGGEVIFQTYHPAHYAVQCAAQHDFKGFAERELAFRRELGYPPTLRLARLVYTHPDDDHARVQAERLAVTIRATLRDANLPDNDLIGPAPAFIVRVRGRYRWQLLLRGFDPARLLRTVEIPPGWIVDVDPVEML